MSNEENKRTTKQPNFSIQHNLMTAWRLLDKTKGPFWAVCLAMIFSAVVLVTVIASILHVSDQVLLRELTNGSSLLRPDLFILAGFALLAPLLVGCKMVAVKRARGEAIELYSGFAYFKQWTPAAVVIVVIEGLILLVSTLMMKFLSTFSPATLPVQHSNDLAHHAATHVAGAVQLTPSHALFIMLAMFALTLIVLLIRSLFMFAVPLLIEHKVSAWRALQGSFLLARPHLMKLSGLMLLLVFGFNFLSLFLIGLLGTVGLMLVAGAAIWAVPFIFLNIGVAYHRLVTSPAEVQAAMAEANKISS